MAAASVGGARRKSGEFGVSTFLLYDAQSIGSHNAATGQNFLRSPTTTTGAI
jgi:hypothetical protein